MCVCACAHVCVCACMHACVCMCVRVHVHICVCDGGRGRGDMSCGGVVYECVHLSACLVHGKMSQQLVICANAKYIQGLIDTSTLTYTFSLTSKTLIQPSASVHP